jgi:uncharacterized protein YbgA (DUF1722 family)
MQALSQASTPGRHANVLQHILGFLKNTLEQEQRTDLDHVIQEIGQGNAPAQTAIDLINRHLQNQPNPYLQEHYYLNPDPRELAIRDTFLSSL